MTQKGAANGVAPLDSSGKIPASNLPPGGAITGGQLTNPIYGSQDPIAATELATRRFSTNTVDFGTLYQRYFNQTLSGFNVSQITPTNGFVNTTWVAGTGDLTSGYGLLTSPTNAAIRVIGCSGSQFIVTPSTVPAGVYHYCMRQSEAGIYTLQTVVSSPWFDFTTIDQGTRYRVLIDGKPTSAYPFKTPGVTGNSVEYRITMDGRPHRISIEFSAGASIGAFVSPNGSSDFSAPDWSAGPTVVVMGDSKTEPTILSYTNPVTGVTVPNLAMGDAAVMCSYMGWQDCHVAGRGGTGFVNQLVTLTVTSGGTGATSGATWTSSGGGTCDRYPTGTATVSGVL